MSVICEIFLILNITLFVVFMHEIVIPVFVIFDRAKNLHNVEVRINDGRMIVKHNDILGVSEYGHIKFARKTLINAYYDALLKICIMSRSESTTDACLNADERLL